MMTSADGEEGVVVAKNYLAGKIALVLSSVLALAACGFLSGDYPTKDPKEIGDTVELLRREMTAGLSVRPTESRATFGEFCGEDWHDKKSVAPEADDPWKVAYNQYKFRTDVTISVRSGTDAPPIYTGLMQHLKKAGGWSVTEQRSANGFLGGIGGEKQGVRLSSYQTPDGNGGIKVYVQLETDCYKHPNA
jgi:hypothetical protein